MRAGALSLSLAGFSTGEAGRDSSGELSLAGVVGFRRTDGLTNSTTTQTQVQSFELSHPNVYPIYELPKHVHGLVLEIQAAGFQGSNRMLERSPSEGSVRDPEGFSCPTPSSQLSPTPSLESKLGQVPFSTYRNVLK